MTTYTTLTTTTYTTLTTSLLFLNYILYITATWQPFNLNTYWYCISSGCRNFFYGNLTATRQPFILPKGCRNFFTATFFRGFYYYGNLLLEITTITMFLFKNYLWNPVNFSSQLFSAFHIPNFFILNSIKA